ncbi:MAG: hypothetical protein AMS19_11440 [Gemmatimonas sp. SG8_23]|nr:MAG: hypothetical protein AMS19_11440 [Gemmatimonas sp. SG8_23]
MAHGLPAGPCAAARDDYYGGESGLEQEEGMHGPGDITQREAIHRVVVLTGATLSSSTVTS